MNVLLILGTIPKLGQHTLDEQSTLILYAIALSIVISLIVLKREPKRREKGQHIMNDEWRQ